MLCYAMLYYSMLSLCDKFPCSAVLLSVLRCQLRHYLPLLRYCCWQNVPVPFTPWSSLTAQCSWQDSAPELVNPWTAAHYVNSLCRGNTYCLKLRQYFFFLRFVILIWSSGWQRENWVYIERCHNPFSQTAAYRYICLSTHADATWLRLLKASRMY
jgi:hypothetical protein